ncbi:MAG: UDP-N-acetylglucosamine--N-acetylmuramyl-(pentapeptide) pyrophosphoryl-undecaprenol N-acetylglucosamine transferase [Actinomycetota bacterium]
MPSLFSRTSGPVLITGGGTAGHTNPGIAVGQALVAEGLAVDEVHFVGGVRGNERDLVPEAGFTIDLLPGRGIQRRLSPRGLLANVGAVAGLLSGLVKGLVIVARRRPRAVLCLGGYAAFAVSAAAVVLRVPLVVTEQNARASAVNRLFGRFAKANAVPFPGTDLPDGVLTGNPIRQAIVEAVGGGDGDRAAKALFERYADQQPDATGPGSLAGPTRPTILAVWAGSLGATRINTAVNELAERWADRTDVIIYHVVGHRDWDSHGGPQPEQTMPYLRVAYENHMPDLLVAADVAVCRAGASTVTELAVAGLPAVLVPLPNAPRDHQRANTGELEEAGAAIVVGDAEVDGARLAELLDPLVGPSAEAVARREDMAAAARSVARPDAAADVARLVLTVSGGTPGRSEGESARPDDTPDTDVSTTSHGNDDGSAT